MSSLRAKLVEVDYALFDTDFVQKVFIWHIYSSFPQGPFRISKILCFVFRTNAENMRRSKEEEQCKLEKQIATCVLDGLA